MLSGGIFAVVPEAQYRLQDHNGPGAELRAQKFSDAPKGSPLGALRFFLGRVFCPVWPDKNPNTHLDWFLESTSTPPAPQPLTTKTPTSSRPILARSTSFDSRNRAWWPSLCVIGQNSTTRW